MDIKVSQDTIIVFDLDDTLYNELDYLKSAYRSIALLLERDNWKPLYSRMLALYRSKVNVFEFLAANYHIEVRKLIEIYRNHSPNIELFEGVVELFEEIKYRGGKIGIITDGRSATQKAKIESLGISKYLDKIVVSEELGSEKPDVANFKAIERELFGDSYYYIADNLKKDFIAPNLLGWTSVALIDNGKNIHFDAHNYMTGDYQPKEYIININDIRII